MYVAAVVIYASPALSLQITTRRVIENILLDDTTVEAAIGTGETVIGMAIEDTAAAAAMTGTTDTEEVIEGRGMKDHQGTIPTGITEEACDVTSVATRPEMTGIDGARAI